MGYIRYASAENGGNEAENAYLCPKGGQGDFFLNHKMLKIWQKLEIS